MITKKFSREYLRDELDLPGGKNQVSSSVVERRRWATTYEIVFRTPDDRFWQALYDVGSTECQDQGPWDYEEEVECTQVELIERIVKVWQPVKD